MTSSAHSPEALRIGWGQADITPSEPVAIAGQFHVRISEGVDDPITLTALAIDSGSDHAMFLTVDVVGQSDDMIQLIQEQAAKLDGLDPSKIILSVTHTHCSAETRLPKPGLGNLAGNAGLDLPVMDALKYLQFLAEQAGKAMAQAWNGRIPGKLAYGMTHAVIGRNRRWTNLQGEGTMYGDTTKPNFSHIEGYEDPTINIIATYDMGDQLTGVVVNTACPSQASESNFTITADFWHDTRLALRQRHGEKLFILPQCSSAGDQSPRPIWGKPAEARMLELKGQTLRQQIAQRLAAAVDEVLPAIKPTASSTLKFQHIVRPVSVPMNKLTQKDADDALASAAEFMKTYEELKKKFEDNPELRNEPRWYVDITRVFRRANWFKGVADRYEQTKINPNYDTVIHGLRIGDMALTTQPFEYYLDFGIRIKARSPAVQTFLLQLVGKGTYCPSDRSVAGGGYGSVPASNIVGPEGGTLLCEKSLEMLNELWPDAEHQK